MKRIALIVGLALLGGACARTPEGGSGATLIPQKGGEVSLQSDGVWRTVTETVSLARGDRVKVSGFGGAFVELPSGMLELRHGSTVRMGAVPELETGSLLAQAVSDLSVGIGPVQVRAEDSLYRLDRSFSVRVGVYHGAVSLSGSGWDGTVSALRQIGVVGGTVPRGPVALQVDPGDPWDDRLLGDAIELGDRLDRLQEGVAFQLPRRGGRDAVAAALPLDPRMVLEGIPQRAPAARLSEALVASVVASVAAPARDVAPEDVFAQVMALRRLGASWIVVSAEWGLGRSALETLVRQVSALLTSVLAPSLGPGSPSIEGGGTRTGSPSSGGSSGGETDGGGIVDEPTGPPSSEPPSCLDLLCTVVEDVLDTDLGVEPTLP